MFELGRIRRADPRVPGPQAARQAIPPRQEGPQVRGLQTGKGAAAERGGRSHRRLVVGSTKPRVGSHPSDDTVALRLVWKRGSKHRSSR